MELKKMFFKVSHKGEELLTGDLFVDKPWWRSWNYASEKVKKEVYKAYCTRVQNPIPIEEFDFTITDIKSV